MSEADAITLEEGKEALLHATWSRSGRRLLVTVTNRRWDEPRQIALTREQVEELRRFLTRA